MLMKKTHTLITFLIAGAAVGVFGVALFGAVHAAIIVPIWTRLFGGIPFCAAAGLAMGWALFELQASGRMGTGSKGALAFGFWLWAALLPMTLFGIIVRATGIHGPNDLWETVVETILAFGAGAAAGRIIGGRWRAGLALGAASLALALAQGGPIPVLNSALAVIYLFSGLALGFVVSVIPKRKGSTA